MFSNMPLIVLLTFFCATSADLCIYTKIFILWNARLLVIFYLTQVYINPLA